MRNPELAYRLAVDHQRELMAQAQAGSRAMHASRKLRSRPAPTYALIRHAFATAWNTLTGIHRAVKSPAQI